MGVEVVVVGAGIIGLSTAVAIQQRTPSVRVTIVADKFGRDTTSIGAGGIFAPTAVGIDEKTSHLWASEGAKHFFDLGFSAESGTSGVNLITGFELMNTDKKKPWFQYMPFVAKMTPELLQRFAPYYKYGFVYTTVIVEGPKYLPWLMKRFKENGGKVVEQKISSFEELSGVYDLVVNCTGLGSRGLASDTDLHPVRGQLIRLTAPWIKHFVHTDDSKYIMPASETVAVGGEKQPNRTDMAPLASDHHAAWNSLRDRFPALEGSKVLYDWVGLRPQRSKVRLEKEMLNFNGKRLQVIHNYGHGAFGISLSWGTAVHVSKLVEDIVRPVSKL
ncbi:D-aspartate oxidase [Aplysia californica]|uniref:D-aspartate oxidase n=1 Tax=Aplysia californica TaxID=6500 RepID=A0ABM0JDK6_APLCA|nr:D-aspartate oxidase [Aplysia californica]